MLGLDPEAAGRCWGARIGVVLGHGGIEKDLTVQEALEWPTDFFSRPRLVLGLIRAGRVDGQAFGAVKTLTGLQRRSLDLALGLVGDPDLSDGGRHWLRLFAHGFRSARRPARWRHHSCPWPTAGGQHGGEIGVLVIYSAGALLVVALPLGTQGPRPAAPQIGWSRALLTSMLFGYVSDWWRPRRVGW